MDRIVESFAQRKEETHFPIWQAMRKSRKNDYNLSVSSYVEAEDTREKIDIEKLNAEIEQIVDPLSRYFVTRLQRSLQKSRCDNEWIIYAN